MIITRGGGGAPSQRVGCLTLLLDGGEGPGGQADRGDLELVAERGAVVGVVRERGLQTGHIKSTARGQNPSLGLFTQFLVREI